MNIFKSVTVVCVHIIRWLHKLTWIYKYIGLQYCVK